MCREFDEITKECITCGMPEKISWTFHPHMGTDDDIYGLDPSCFDDLK